MCRQVFSFCLSQCGVHCACCCATDVRHIVGSRTLSGATEFTSSTSQCEQTRHGSGAVILRASRNAGDKPVKRKRGGRSAATIAARIEGGYSERSGTAGSTACDQSNHVDDRGTTDGSGDVLPSHCPPTF